MKTLSTEQQTELQELLSRVADSNTNDLDANDRHDLVYWAIELKPKRVRKKKGYTGLDLNTEEGVIEQAYQEHTGNV